jgi:hypothetical protein
LVFFQITLQSISFCLRVQALSATMREVFSGAESKYRSDRQPLIMETIGDIDRFLDNGVQSFD